MLSCSHPSTLPFDHSGFLPPSHEIKRHLHFGRKAVTNLESVFKSRDISLSTKVHIVKAVIFPVVTYGCESWIIKKAEH